MKTFGLIAVLSTALLTACVSVQPANDAQFTIDKADELSLKEQLTEGLKREIAKINTPVQVSNITSLSETTKTIQGKTKLVLTFKTADGKTYTTHQEPTALTDVQRERLRKIKGATLRGVIAVQDRPNEFFFGGLENPVY